LLGALGDQIGRARALDRALDETGDPGDRVELAIAAAGAQLHVGDAQVALARAREAVDILDRGTGAPAELRRRALVTLGEAAWRARDWGEVERACGELVASGHPAPERTEWAHRLGTARAHPRRTDAAAAAYELVLAEPATPVDVRIATWRSLAALHEHTADLGRAARAYESFAADRRAELSETARADAWYRAGDLYRKAGGREEDARR